MSELLYWVWLSRMQKIKSAVKYKVLQHFGSPKNLFFADLTEIRRHDWLQPFEKRSFADRTTGPAYEILEQCTKNGIDIVTLRDSKYPERLGEIYDPPLLLYVKGRLPVMDEEAAVAIVGTRKCSPYGKRIAEKLGYEISRGGGLIVSGLAAGIDTEGAVGALQAGAPVVGVLGCGIDVVYPRSNAQLYADITQVGALVTEYPPGTEPFKMNFPQRNRIISGLSESIVVVEAPKKSGALITAGLALEQGRDVFAVPGNVDAYNSQGCNQLLSEGAIYARDAEDILRPLADRFPTKIKLGRAPETKYLMVAESAETSDLQGGFEERDFGKMERSAKKIIDKGRDKSYIDLKEQLEDLSEDELAVVKVLTKNPIHVDDLIAAAGLPANRVMAALTMLTIRGHAAEHTGKRFSLIIIQK